MKRFIKALIISMLCVYLLLLTLFDNVFSLTNMSNALFIVGMPMFFFGLIVITNAAKVFVVVSYSFKIMLKKNDTKMKSFYDYSNDRNKTGKTPYAIQFLIISICYIIVSLILSDMFISQLG